MATVAVGGRIAPGWAAAPAVTGGLLRGIAVPDAVTLRARGSTMARIGSRAPRIGAPTATGRLVPATAAVAGIGRSRSCDVGGTAAARSSCGVASARCAYDATAAGAKERRFNDDGDLLDDGAAHSLLGDLGSTRAGGRGDADTDGGGGHIERRTDALDAGDCSE